MYVHGHMMRRCIADTPSRWKPISGAKVTLIIANSETHPLDLWSNRMTPHYTCYSEILAFDSRSKSFSDTRTAS